MADNSPEGDHNMIGHTQKNIRTGSGSNVFHKVDNIEKIILENAGSVVLNPEDMDDVVIKNEISGNQTILLQLPNDSATALEIIDGLVKRGLIADGSPLFAPVDEKKKLAVDKDCDTGNA